MTPNIRSFFLLFAVVLFLSSTVSAATFTVTKTADTNDGVCDADCSLREALAVANSNPDHDIVIFDSTYFSTPRTIVINSELSNAEYAILEIRGPGMDLLTIDGNNATRIFFNNFGGLAYLSGTTFKNANGAAGYNHHGALILSYSRFIDNRAIEGGALHNDSGPMRVIDCIFERNTAETHGGAIYTDSFDGMSDSMTISGSTFIQNVAGNNSGAVVGGGRLDLSDSVFRENRAQRFGGAASGGGTISRVVFINNEAITEGGGALTTGGETLVQDCHFSGNKAKTNGGAIHVGDGTGNRTLTIRNTEITNNNAENDGGGMRVGRHPINLVDSNIHGNVAGRYGRGYAGDSAFSELSINSSRIANNIAERNGGGIFHGSGTLNLRGVLVHANTARGNSGGEGGGGIYTGVSTLSLYNTTIVGNTTPKSGGGLFNRGTVNLDSSTIARNDAGVGGGGVQNFNQQSVNTRNTLIGGNAAPEGRDYRGLMNSLGHNIIESSSGLVLSGITTGNILNADPQLGTLGMNGGALPTISLRPFSPAIDAADPNNFPATDQRGIARAQDGDINGTFLPDIGAYERKVTVFSVNSGQDTNDGSCDSNCSLRDAITASNQSTDPDQAIIYDLPSGQSNTMILSGGEISISGSGSLLLRGTGSGSTINANYASRIFSISGMSDLSLENFTLTGGNGSGLEHNGNGGAIYAALGAKLSLNNVTVTLNRAGGPSSYGVGGGIAIYNGTLNINNSTISNNSGNSGGGIHRTDGSAEIRRTSIVNNVAGTGGGINNFGGGITLFATNIENNQGSSGGGLSFSGGTLVMSGSSVHNNRASDMAGGLLLLNCDAVISNSTISRNTSVFSGGGGVYLGSGSLTLNHATIVFNDADLDRDGMGDGGGVRAAGTFRARNSIIARNRAANGNDVLGNWMSQGYNLIENTAGNNIGGVLTGNVLNQNPHLDPIARSNGGPTLTHSLRPISPAIDAGAASSPFTNVDQRGRTRPVDIVSVVNAAGGNASDIGAFERQLDDPIPPTTPYDFDGDGKADVGVWRQDAGTWFMLQSTAGSAAASWGYGTDLPALGDYDGDGKTDITVVRDGTWFVSKSSGGSEAISWGFGTDKIVPGDYDGDGKTDAAIFRDGVWWILRSSGGYDAISFGNPTDKLVPGDYDGDGKTDVAVFREGIWWILKTTGGVDAVQWGYETDTLVPADYDGDGKTDIAVFRDGTWFVRKSSGGSDAINWGYGTDKLAPADYDGDGKTDAAIVRDGVFWILKTSGGYDAISFGFPTDRPVSQP